MILLTWQDCKYPGIGEEEEVHPKDVGDASQLRHRVEAEEAGKHDYGLQTHEQPEWCDVKEAGKNEPRHQLGNARKGSDPRGYEGVIVCKSNMEILHHVLMRDIKDTFSWL